MEISKVLSEELNLKPTQVEAVLSLIDEGDTIPFIARYRKEKTGEMDDVTLRKFAERLTYLKGLEERRKSVLESIEEQGKLTPELKAQIESVLKLSDLENLYRPYKKKRATRASIAVEAGLLPLAEYILKQRATESELRDFAKTFINEEKKVPDADKAIAGALDIIAEKMSDVSSYVTSAIDYIKRTGRLISKETKLDVEKEYLTYASFSSPVRAIKNHQILALNRGEKEKKLSVSFEYDIYTIINQISRDYLVPHSPFENEIRATALDSYKRLIAPIAENEVRNELFVRAEDSSIDLFKENLRQLLMTKPLKGQRILGFDPAFVNGCKLAALDENGKLLEVGVVYPTIGGASRIEESKRVVLDFIKRFKITYIALGNGTASRESEAFLLGIIKENNLDVHIVIVSEAGASVYSASPLAVKEFPSLPVEKRSAISLARRLIDPLSELVKIDPYSLGVGQYQHDMDQKKLTLALQGVVEDSVNEVGVYLNYASSSLLSYVSGIGPKLAEGIVAYRDGNGSFHSRKELLKVPKLGKKAYEQCAGFLRIAGEYPLDNTAVHPESYGSALSLLEKLSLSLADLGTPKAEMALSGIEDFASLAAEVGVGELTLKDIVDELAKPGRDPREKAASAVLESGVTDIKDVKNGMILTGTVRNVMDFGAFIDIGVHQDGLVHISEMADHFVSSPFEVVKIGDIVRCKVISVDVPRHRIGLSFKDIDK